MKSRLTPTILRFDSLPSTNTEAARQAALGAPEGLCVVAREQTAGRGRQQRAWASPKDAGLYFSVVLRPRLEAREWPLVTLAAALAAGRATEHTYRAVLQAFIESFGSGIVATNEPKRVECGAPDGGKDENVFDIQQGVAICLMVKRENSKNETRREKI